MLAIPFILYYIAAAVIGLFIGMYIFDWLNQKFDIYYFGFKGVVATFGSCWGIATAATYYLGWFALIIFIIMSIVRVFKRPAK